MLSAEKVLNNDLFIHSYAVYHLQVIVPCTRTLYNSKIKKKKFYFCLILSHVF
jgi:hypothetical protein